MFVYDSIQVVGWIAEVRMKGEYGILGISVAGLNPHEHSLIRLT
ncbi:hypothetical protein [Piscirickettsia salmonis]|nr:hypothetical protein [Piscirickettsia salmonis]